MHETTDEAMFDSMLQPGVVIDDDPGTMGLELVDVALVLGVLAVLAWVFGSGVQWW